MIKKPSIQKIIYFLSGLVTSIRTRGGEHHHQAWITVGDTNVIVFKLTACQDAWAMFTTYFGQDQVSLYEIGLGIEGNRVEIKKDYVVVSIFVPVSKHILYLRRMIPLRSHQKV